MPGFPLAMLSCAVLAGRLLPLLLTGSLLHSAESGGADESARRLTECPAPGSTVEVRGSVKLRAGCVLRKVRFVVRASHVTLDCNGVELHGLMNRDTALAAGAAYPAEDSPERVAFLIENGESDRPIEDVTIRDCTVRNYQDGAEVALRLSEATQRALRDGADAEAIESRLRAAAPRDIRFERVSVVAPHKSGLFVNRYAQHVVFRGGSVTGAGNSAIYLNSGSSGHEIVDNWFQGNGYANYDAGKRVSMPRRGSALREAIAVDSSAHNLIRGNRFQRNGAGGVFLYKNCWEHHDEPDQIPRRMHSSDNRIEGNRFVAEPVGVWIASRQSRDLAGFECGDPPEYEEGFWLWAERYYRDYAERTVVSGNRFEGVGQGVIVEDDDASILDNVFAAGGTQQSIAIGRTVRDGKLGRGLRGTRVIGNVFDTGTACPIRRAIGTQGSVFRANTVRSGQAIDPC